MSEENENERDRSDRSLPSFSNYGMPTDIYLDVDDDDIEEETTRRVGGATFAPAFTSVSTPPIDFEDSYIRSSQPKPGGPRWGLRDPTPETESGWKLEKAPTLPEYHPLDRASVFCPHTSVAVVANRIAKILKERSIEGDFDDDKAKVTCLTSYNVDFRIFLYRGQKSFSHGVIVEVQRRAGGSVLFVQDSKAILDAAQDLVPSPPLSSSAEIPLVSDNEDDDEDVKAAVSSLSFVEKLLAHDRYDATLLALQTLSSLTDPARMGKYTSESVSKALVADGNAVGSKVFDIVTARSSAGDEYQEEYNLAMGITANVLRNVNGNIPSFYQEAIRPILIKDLENAEKKPQRSYTAARCIEPLIARDHCASDLHVALETARNVGEARHNALRAQAEKCIKLIGL